MLFLAMGLVQQTSSGDCEIESRILQLKLDTKYVWGQGGCLAKGLKTVHTDRLHVKGWPAEIKPTWIILRGCNVIKWPY